MQELITEQEERHGCRDTTAVEFTSQLGKFQISKIFTKFRIIWLHNCCVKSV